MATYNTLYNLEESVWIIIPTYYPPESLCKFDEYIIEEFSVHQIHIKETSKGIELEYSLIPITNPNRLRFTLPEDRVFTTKQNAINFLQAEKDAYNLQVENNWI